MTKGEFAKVPLIVNEPEYVVTEVGENAMETLALVPAAKVDPEEIPVDEKAVPVVEA